MIDPLVCFFVVSQVADSNGEFFLKSSELFESPVYLEEVADVLCILQAGTQLLSSSKQFNLEVLQKWNSVIMALHKSAHCKNEKCRIIMRVESEKVLRYVFR